MTFNPCAPGLWSFNYRALAKCHGQPVKLNLTYRPKKIGNQFRAVHVIEDLLPFLEPLAGMGVCNVQCS